MERANGRGRVEPDRGRGLRRALLAAAVVGLLAVRGLAGYRENVHWDEFALLHLADRTHETGVLEAGGRPGLAVVLLQPFVSHCDDEVAVVRRARLLWMLWLALYVAGVAVWARALAPDAASRGADAALAVGLLVLVPAFLDTSVQVRTDTLALAGGAWGGAALLASRRRPALAAASGAAFALGLLGSQKVLYVASLALLLAAGQQALARELRPAREARRLALLAAGAGLVLAAWRVGVDLAFRVRPGAPAHEPLTAGYLGRGLSLFDFYRHTIGFSQYREMLPTLVPHGLLLAALAAGTLVALRRRAPQRGRLALAWAALALGAAVALFHAAAFSYFWLTLGLFPALAFALARAPLAALAPLDARARRLVAAGFWLLLATPAALALPALLADGQAVQRETLAFVHRNFDRRAVGFSPESALFCQQGQPPFPTFFSQHIYQRFAGAGREANEARLMRQFRDAPVEFLIQSFRLDQFPPELRQFWIDNYQPYRASVFVAGRRIDDGAGGPRPIELIVPGRYVWMPFSTPQPVVLDGRLLAAGQVVALSSGPHTANLVAPGEGGILVLALRDPPGPAPEEFYR